MNKKSSAARLGDLLIASELIDNKMLEQALAEQKRTGYQLGRQLLELGCVGERDLLILLSQQLNIPYIDFNDAKVVPCSHFILPEFLARRYRCILLENTQHDIFLGMADPADLFAIDKIQHHIGRPLDISVVSEVQLLDQLDQLYRSSVEVSRIALQVKDKPNYDNQVGTLFLSSETTPVISLLKKIFEYAIQYNASDIHFEPDEYVLRVRFRVDGELVEQTYQEKNIASAVVVRLKLLAHLDIAEKRLPQDGRFQLDVAQCRIDVRLSTLPVQFGEVLSLRIFNQSIGVRPLDSCGMSQSIFAEVNRLIQRPNGLILVTGPTGSGKTTTLYGMLKTLNNSTKKIITVEDPVEYRISRLNQVQVSEKIDLTFSRVLRGALRQDPDILMVGEIRDQESAQIALRAATTGHLVLSTLHTNDVITSALRLIDLGVKPYLVAAGIYGIISQRLVRRLCEHCKTDYCLDADQQVLFSGWLRRYGFDEDKNPTLKIGRGCDKCMNTGYSGRVGIFELLTFDPPLLDAIRREDFREFEILSYKKMDKKTLGYSLLQQLMLGETSFDEAHKFMP